MPVLETFNFIENKENVIVATDRTAFGKYYVKKDMITYLAKSAGR